MSDTPVLGAMSPEEAIDRLRAIGEEDAVQVLEAAMGSHSKSVYRGLESVEPDIGTKSLGTTKGFIWPFLNRPWQYTNHSFGYLMPHRGNGALSIAHVGAVQPDSKLKNARVKVTLDRLRVADYPGRGRHQIMFEFSAKNQLPGIVEDLHFNTTLSVRQGQTAPIIGYPIFVGLNVGSEGLAFQCMTVNVKNDNDEALVRILDSDAFKGGLKLTSIAQPALAPLTDIAVNLTKLLISRRENVKVQEFFLGLDFSDNPMRAPMVEGSFIAVQTPDEKWSWDEWVYELSSGAIHYKDDLTQPIPYNYLVFSVSRYEETA